VTLDKLLPKLLSGGDAVDVSERESSRRTGEILEKEITGESERSRQRRLNSQDRQNISMTASPERQKVPLLPENFYIEFRDRFDNRFVWCWEREKDEDAEVDREGNPTLEPLGDYMAKMKIKHKCQISQPDGHQRPSSQLAMTKDSRGQEIRSAPLEFWKYPVDFRLDKDEWVVSMINQQDAVIYGTDEDGRVVMQDDSDPIARLDARYGWKAFDSECIKDGIDSIATYGDVVYGASSRTKRIYMQQLSKLATAEWVPAFQTDGKSDSIDTEVVSIAVCRSFLFCVDSEGGLRVRDLRIRDGAGWTELSSGGADWDPTKSRTSQQLEERLESIGTHQSTGCLLASDVQGRILKAEFDNTEADRVDELVVSGWTEISMGNKAIGLISIQGDCIYGQSKILGGKDKVAYGGRSISKDKDEQMETNIRTQTQVLRLTGIDWADASTSALPVTAWQRDGVKHPMRSIAVDAVIGGNVLFGVGLSDGKIYKQMTALDWIQVGKGDMREITIHGDTVYAVSAEGRIYKQLLSHMTLESDWLLICDVGHGDEMCSIAVDCNTIYGVRKKDGAVCKQMVSSMNPSSEWSVAASIADGMQMRSISIHGSSIYGVNAPDGQGLGKVYTQKLQQMDRSSKWSESIPHTQPDMLHSGPRFMKELPIGMMSIATSRSVETYRFKHHLKNVEDVKFSLDPDAGEAENDGFDNSQMKLAALENVNAVAYEDVHDDAWHSTYVNDEDMKIDLYLAGVHKDHTYDIGMQGVDELDIGDRKNDALAVDREAEKFIDMLDNADWDPVRASPSEVRPLMSCITPR
jgi:hypothetical protein